MQKLTFRLLAFISLLSFALSACNYGSEKTEDPSLVVQTSAAQTIETSNLQLTMQAQQVLLTSQAQTLAAPAPVQPAQTQAPVQTEPPPVQTEIPPVQTEAPPIQTEAPLPPQLPNIRANVDTKCRTGPSPAYPIVSYLLVGQQSVVLGANPDQSWWLIEDPRQPGVKCWVWGTTTQVTSGAAAVPVVEPPPLPQVAGPPSFQAEFANEHICGGVAMAVFRVSNTGSADFLSSSILIVDVATGLGIAGPELSNASFVDGPAGCPPGRPGLSPGSAAYIAKGIGAPPSSGKKVRGVIILCTEPNQGGQCAEMKVTFIYP